MTDISFVEIKQQRVAHLVLGHTRPKPDAAVTPAPRRRKGRRIARAAASLAAPVILAPGIEERVALRERWSHKQGTPETHEHVHRDRQRPGSIARLFDAGTIDKDQLAAAQDIADAYRALTADVSVRTASLETRVDGGAHGRAEEERLGRVHCDLAYTWWRDRIGGAIQAVLLVVVHDVGLTIVARDGGISMPRARRMLQDALDLWPRARQRTARAAAATVA
jgi:hypothetical protein